MVARMCPRCEWIIFRFTGTGAKPATHPAVDLLGGGSSEYFGCQSKSRVDAKITGF